MILPAPLVRAILRGHKTQIRRPVRLGETWAQRVGELTILGPAPSDHAPPPRALITAVTRQHLRDLTVPDARAEGFHTVEQFACWWVRFYDDDWVRRREGEVVDALRDHELLERFDARHAPRQVWVIGLVAVPEPRFLVPASGRRDGQEDYCLGHDALGAGEAVDPLTLERYAIEARRCRDGELRSLEERLRSVLAYADEQGVDMSRQVASLEARITAMERKLRRRTAA